MKHAFVLFGMLLLAQLACAQINREVQIDWGPLLKEPSRSTLNTILGEDDNNIYALRRVRYRPMLESYDKRMNLKKSTEVELELDGKELHYEFTVYFNHQLFVFGSRHHPEDSKVYLYYQPVDKYLLRPIGEPIKIASAYSKSVYKQGSFDYELSEDGSKLLILDFSAFQRGENDSYGIKVLDTDMRELWSKKVTLPYKDQLYENEDYIVDHEGNFYTIGVVYKDKRKDKRDGKPNYFYVLQSFTNNGTTENQQQITLTDKFITDLRVAVTENGSIVCAGFYSDEGTFSIKGTFFLTVNPFTGQLVTEGYKQFDKDFMTEFMSEKKANRGKKELYNYDLDRIIVRKDGGAILIAEQYFVEVVTTTGTNPNGATTTRTTYYYHYDNMIVIGINPDRTIDWAVKIPKSQVTANDGGYYSSYIDLITEKNIYVLFNDNPKNLGITGNQRPANFNGLKSIVSLITVDINTGEYKRELLYDNKGNDVIMRPKACTAVSENEILIYGEMRKKFQIGRLTF